MHYAPLLVAVFASFVAGQQPANPQTNPLWITWRNAPATPNARRLVAACSSGGPYGGFRNGDKFSLASDYLRYCDADFEFDRCGGKTAIAFSNPGGVANNNFCLDATLEPANGVQPHIWQCYDGAPQQQWQVHGDGTIELAGRGFCLDVTDGNENKTLQLWQCTGGPNQQWNIAHRY